MHYRCENKKQASFRLYGAKGITVCARWGNFDLFMHDMGMPKPGHSLERLDNNKGYCPSNVVWADKKTQSNHTCRNRSVTIWGETKTLAQWSEDPRCQSNYPNLYYRIIRSGWDPELAILSKRYDIKHQARNNHEQV